MAALYFAELCPVDAAADSCSFLAEAQRYATVTDPFSELPGGLVKGWLGSVV
ncbi:hypothetical protein MHEI_06890 [Mycobacterium heidelbergense]|nr:hypothetical protein MHEI_06890 [Mycobacterium heidelbergense]